MIAVIDYGMGNLHSVSKALEAVGADVYITSQAKDLNRAEKIVLPGVGSFFQGMKHLKDLGLIEALQEQVHTKEKSFLGICLGMQLTAKQGTEFGSINGLDWFDAQVKAFQPLSKEIKVPHMGWNDVAFTEEGPLFKGLKNPTSFFFVHSYHFVPLDQAYVTARCLHGENFVASLSHKNIHLVQFHPEKSQKYGLKVLENFLNL